MPKAPSRCAGPDPILGGARPRVSTDSTNQRPGRKSIVAEHPRRQDIELARAAGLTFTEVGRRFGVSRSAVDRHWHSLTSEHRAALVDEIAAVRDGRFQEMAVGLALIARRHPEAMTEMQALLQRTQYLPGIPGPAGATSHAR